MRAAIEALDPQGLQGATQIAVEAIAERFGDGEFETTLCTGDRNQQVIPSAYRLAAFREARVADFLRVSEGRGEQVFGIGRFRWHGLLDDPVLAAPTTSGSTMLNQRGRDRSHITTPMRAIADGLESIVCLANEE